MIQINFFGDYVVKDVEKLSISDELNTLISTANYNCLNFEAPLVGAEKNHIEKSGPSIYMDNKAVDFLADNHFNLVSLANNHIMDMGESGLNETILRLKDISFGAGKGKDAYKPFIVDKDGVKIAFLAVTHKEFCCVIDENEIGSAWMCHPDIYTIIRKVKTEVDFLFIIAHAGIEYIDIPIPEIRRLYKSFIDAGGDAIVASHPHVPQGYEHYKEKPIFYSLGNFCFQNEVLQINRPYWNNSLAISFYIDSYSLSYEVHNIYYSQLDGKLSIDNTSEIQKHISYCNSLLNNTLTYEKTLDKYLHELRPFYTSMFNGSGWFQSKFGKNLLRFLYYLLTFKRVNPRHLLNAFQCESHRWLVIRMLENNIL